MEEVDASLNHAGLSGVLRIRAAVAARTARPIQVYPIHNARDPDTKYLTPGPAASSSTAASVTAEADNLLGEASR